MTSLVDEMVKNLPAKWETWVWSLGQEDLLEKGMGTHSSILAWEILWAEEPGGLQSLGSKRVRQDLATKQHPRVCICRFQPPSPSYPLKFQPHFQPQSHSLLGHSWLLGFLSCVLTEFLLFETYSAF